MQVVFVVLVSRVTCEGTYTEFVGAYSTIDKAHDAILDKKTAFGYSLENCDFQQLDEYFIVASTGNDEYDDEYLFKIKQVEVDGGIIYGYSG